MVITLHMQDIVWREIWAGKESPDGFLPKPSLDRARTAQRCWCKPPNRETGSELGVTGSSPVTATKRGSEIGRENPLSKRLQCLDIYKVGAFLSQNFFQILFIVCIL